MESYATNTVMSAFQNSLQLRAGSGVGFSGWAMKIQTDMEWKKNFYKESLLMYLRTQDLSNPGPILNYVAPDPGGGTVECGPIQDVSPVSGG